VHIPEHLQHLVRRSGHRDDLVIDANQAGSEHQPGLVWTTRVWTSSDASVPAAIVSGQYVELENADWSAVHEIKRANPGSIVRGNLSVVLPDPPPAP